MKSVKKVKWPKLLFFTFIIRPIVFVALGLNIINRNKLPKNGPAIIVANHTSHLDTLVLMSLFPLSKLNRVRPVAAADYFLKNKWIAWFSINCLDIIPIARGERLAKDVLFEACHSALDQGDIVILFPEGTRSLTEDRTYLLKRGIHILATDYSGIKVVPVLLRGLGKSLPKGTALFVPFNCDVMIDEELVYVEDQTVYLNTLEARYQELLLYCITK